MGPKRVHWVPLSESFERVRGVCCASQVSAGGDHALILAAGEAFAVGDNRYGQLAVGHAEVEGRVGAGGVGVEGWGWRGGGGGVGGGGLGCGLWILVLVPFERGQGLVV